MGLVKSLKILVFFDSYFPKPYPALHKKQKGILWNRDGRNVFQLD